MNRPKHTCWSCGAIYVDVGHTPLRCPRCGTDPQEVPQLPAEILRDVHWSFVPRAPKEEDGLRAALLASHPDQEHPLPAEALDLVLPTWRVRLVFNYRGDDTGELVSRQAPLTALGLLHHVHLAWGRRLAKVDHHFFEGFALLRAPKGTDSPVYSMRLGS